MKLIKWITIFVLVAVGLVTVKILTPTGKTTLNPEQESFSACLADSGAKFYGASWCPHCNTQKDMLGESVSKVYIECSLPDRSGQTPICNSEGIRSYPTWRFADGSE